MPPSSKPPGIPIPVVVAACIWERMSRSQQRRLMRLAPVFLKKSGGLAADSDEADAPEDQSDSRHS